MKRLLFLSLIAVLGVMLFVTAASANGTSPGDQAAVTTETYPPATTGTTTQQGALGPGVTIQPGTTMDQTPMDQPVVTQPGMVNQQVVTQQGMVATGQWAAYSPAIAIENQDLYVVTGGSIFKFDRDLNMTRQAALTLPAATTVGGTTTVALSNPAISVENLDVYVVAGNMVWKFDRDLNLTQQAALPVPVATIAMQPGQMMGTMGQMGTTGQIAMGQPLVCPPGMQPGVMQPGVAGFREQPAQRWMTNLSGDPLQVSTNATGDAEFWLSNQGQTLNYRLNARNITNVTGAHLHLMQPGVPLENSPIVAPLFTPRRATTAVSGRLASGSITARDLTGPFRGQPLSALVDAINQGRVVVNVHTTSHQNGAIAGMLSTNAQ